MTGPIIIEEYDPFWPQQFEMLRSRIVSIGGPLLTEIEHVGSTAVPGLAAKAIIDIDILLRSSADLPRAIERLYSLGYLHQGDRGIPGREAFRAPLHDFPHHLYVCLPEYPEFARHIAFRDYLRAHPEDRKAYARLKHDLEKKFRLDRGAYTEAKGEFVTSILGRAKRSGTF